MKYGPLTLKYTYHGMSGVFSEALGDIIYTVHDKNGFCLSRKEQKLYKPR